MSDCADPLLGKRETISDELEKVEKLLRTSSLEADAVYTLNHELNHFKTLVASPMYLLFPTISLLNLSLLRGYLQWHITSYPGIKVSIPCTITALYSKDELLQERLSSLLQHVCWIEFIKQLFWDSSLSSLQPDNQPAQYADNRIEFFLLYLSHIINFGIFPTIHFEGIDYLRHPLSQLSVLDLLESHALLEELQIKCTLSQFSVNAAEALLQDCPYSRPILILRKLLDGDDWLLMRLLIRLAITTPFDRVTCDKLGLTTIRFRDWHPVLRLGELLGAWVATGRRKFVSEITRNKIPTEEEIVNYANSLTDHCGWPRIEAILSTQEATDVLREYTAYRPSFMAELCTQPPQFLKQYVQAAREQAAFSRRVPAVFLTGFDLSKSVNKLLQAGIHEGYPVLRIHNGAWVPWAHVNAPSEDEQFKTFCEWLQTIIANELIWGNCFRASEFYIERTLSLLNSHRDAHAFHDELMQKAFGIPRSHFLNHNSSPRTA